jgi:myo-inositol 2-dehydrogenase/D-chiro-inositol 1-dehydrogenase
MTSHASTGQGPAVRVGLIGAGLMGKVHARNLQNVVKGAELVAIADVSEGDARDLATSLGVEHLHLDGRELIDADYVDAVIVASPDLTHGPLVLAAIEAGKPVLCEKPLAGTVAEAEQIVRRESKLDRPLVQVGFMREFDATHQAVRDIARSGRIGEVVLVRGQHISPGAGTGANGPSAAAGVIGALIHDIHSIRFLSGHEIESVFVRNRYLPDGSTHLITGNFGLEGGGVATVDVNFEARFGYAVNAEVVGTLGTASTVSPHVRGLFEDATAKTDVTTTFQERFGTAYLAEVEGWIKAVRLGVRPTGPNAWDGYAASAVADACIRSITSGRPEIVDMIPTPECFRMGAATSGMPMQAAS